MQRTYFWVVMILVASLSGILVSNLVTPAVAQNQQRGQQGRGVSERMGDPKPGEPLQTKDISAEQAHAVLAAAMKKAEEIGSKMDIAIVDAGGNLKAFIRMDGAWLGSIDIAQKKARTARFFDMNSGEIGKLSQPGGPLYNIEHSNNGLITFPGGVPLRASDGTIIGAIGVSGDTVEKDHDVAQAGANVLGGK
jgi:uncharacterized protein GlcG (DUF336 family)